MTDDFFRSRLDQMIDSSHPLAVLASRLSWKKMESRVAPQFAHKVRPFHRSLEAPDLAGLVVKVSGGTASNAGRLRLSTRLMITLAFAARMWISSIPIWKSSTAAGSSP